MMTEHEVAFLEKIKREYLLMKNLLLSVVGVLLVLSVTLGSVQIASDATLKANDKLQDEDIKYIKENGVAVQAIDKIIIFKFSNRNYDSVWSG